MFFFFFMIVMMILSKKITTFAFAKKTDDMTTLELNAQLFRELSVIAEDEGMMKKALKAIKRLAAQKRAKDEMEGIMSSPAMAEIIREGEKEIEEGDFHAIAIEDLWK